MEKEDNSKFELVEILDEEARISHQIIAEQTKNKEKSILDLITKYKKEFEKMGILKFNDFKSLNSKGGRPQKI